MGGIPVTFTVVTCGEGVGGVVLATSVVALGTVTVTVFAHAAVRESVTSKASNAGTRFPRSARRHTLSMMHLRDRRRVGRHLGRCRRDLRPTKRTITMITAMPAAIFSDMCPPAQGCRRSPECNTRRFRGCSHKINPKPQQGQLLVNRSGTCGCHPARSAAPGQDGPAAGTEIESTAQLATPVRAPLSENQTRSPSARTRTAG